MYHVLGKMYDEELLMITVRFTISAMQLRERTKRLEFIY
jgi:hypothetical protein